MKRIYSILVENRSGVLCKVAGLFWRRCFNIDSIVVGETDDKAVSSMIIVSNGDQRTLEQIEKQLNKKLDVIKVKTFSETESLNRELLLIKIRYNRSNRRDIMENCEIMDAKPETDSPDAQDAGQLEGHIPGTGRMSWKWQR